jgi:hypothetical protein
VWRNTDAVDPTTTLDGKDDDFIAYWGFVRQEVCSEEQAERRPRCLGPSTQLPESCVSDSVAFSLSAWMFSDNWRTAEFSVETRRTVGRHIDADSEGNVLQFARLHTNHGDAV